MIYQTMTVNGILGEAKEFANDEAAVAEAERLGDEVLDIVERIGGGHYLVVANDDRKPWD